MTIDRTHGWRPSASRLAIETRASLLGDIRAFFALRKVLEVETPILSKAGNTDPNITGICTASASPRYLRTSPEYPMKRLLAAGLRDIYELGRVFRAGESGAWHNPEFTLLEWYRTGKQYLELAEEVIDLVKHCGRGRFDGWSIARHTYRDLFLNHTGLDPKLAGESDWAALADERGIQAGSLDQLQWQDLILTHIIQPALDPCSMTLVFDYPPDQAALARIRQGDEPVAERFELYLGQAELANGYQELPDAAEQRRRFEHENYLRGIRGETTPLIDTRLLEALQHGIPECSGVALGVDRMLMCLMDLDRIDAVLAFPHDRA
ncbi:MAG TPA: EF-P lysine aminoacylase EpmA [Xanthomonadales bacterium]|nr:EF-P lysine aminoacylase EpmA [Xanthomonadales bacterium]